MNDELQTPDEVAARIKKPVGTLGQWRHRNFGPRWMKIGGSVRYRRSEVDRWIAEQEQRTAGAA